MHIISLSYLSCIGLPNAAYFHLYEVSTPRVIETSYRSPQLTLWTLGLEECLLFKKLPE